MKIKLTKFYLFLILLTVLILSSLGIKVLEGMNIIEGNSNIEDSQEPLVDNDNNTAGDGKEYNPFSNSENNEVSDMMQEEKDGSDDSVTGDYDDTTFQPDLRVTFQNSNPSKSKLSYGAKDGITKDQIPPGQEHLYILKSQVVPPVCPKCPDVSSGGGGGGGGKNGKGGRGCGDCCPKPPPCPRPQRCPEPAFTCKKVPNYSASNVDSILPGQSDRDQENGLLNGSGAGAGNGGGAMPVLNSFASFS